MVENEEMKKKIKVLIVGDVGGQFDALSARLKRVHESKHGPFDVVFCVGEFLGTNSNDASTIDCPLPVYFMSKRTSEAEALVTRSRRLHFLKGCGSIRVQELRVVFSTGEASTDALKNVHTKVAVGEPSFSGVDLLLTTSWPKQMIDAARGPDSASSERSDESTGGDLANSLKPRYHFAGGNGFYFARAPYRNTLTRSLAQTHVTRFVGMGRVVDAALSGTTKASKWLHALQLMPMVHMKTSELLKIPAGSTSCPYLNAADTEEGRPLKRRRANGVPIDRPAFSAARAAEIEREERGRALSNGPSASSQFFFQQRRGGGRGGGRGLRNRQPARRACWFCLSTPGFEAHLVASVGTHVYMALPKGPINEGHILLVPIDHNVSSFAVANSDVRNEIDAYLSALRAYFASKKMKIVCFEHNIVRPGVMKHMHLQVVPVTGSSDDASVRRAFERLGEKSNVRFDDLISDTVLRTYSSYFLVTLPSGRRIVHVPPPVSRARTERTPTGCRPSFGREAICGLLGLDKRRVNWKTCVLTKDEETKQTNAFKGTFSPYDPSLK